MIMNSNLKQSLTLAVKILEETKTVSIWLDNMMITKAIILWQINHFTALVVNYGISNTIVLEIP